MRERYRRFFQTPEVERQQLAAYGRVGALPSESGEASELGASEREFISERDSFYMASVSEDGWPYLQHRGGPKGFLKVLDGKRLAFVDFEGNRQLISVGNLAKESRVSLMLMDYVARERLKIVGRAKVYFAEEATRLAGDLGLEMERSSRLVVIEVEGFDWNCPKWITQRFSREQVDAAMEPLRQRIADLERRLGE